MGLLSFLWSFLFGGDKADEFQAGQSFIIMSGAELIIYIYSLYYYFYFLITLSFFNCIGHYRSPERRVRDRIRPGDS